MNDIKIVAASLTDFEQVAGLVRALLVELDPSGADKVEKMAQQLAQELLATNAILAFLAKSGDEYVGVITLHQCAAIYAGGIFGEISELYQLHWLCPN